MALRALKTEEEIASIPLDQPILIELPGGMDETPEKKDLEPDAKQLQEQLEAALAAQKVEKEAREKADREAAEARRLASEREREAQEARKREADLQGDIITGGLSAAQGERDAAKLAFKTAFEAGDAAAMAEAQSRIGRAEAKILTLESGAAEIAERKKVEPKEVRQEPQRQDPIAAIDANPQLLPAEKEWLKNHPDAVLDPRRNNELSVGYDRAMKKGLVRGTPAYFAELEEFMGYKTQTEERETSVQAPVTRTERTGDGRPSNGRITLSPEQREIAKNMGISEIEYARQVAAFDTARRNDPDRYK